MAEPRARVTDDDVVAEVAFLSRSANRVKILECLRERGPIDKRDLAEECDVVRTTLQRNLDGLASEDLIQQCGVGTYELTAVGEEVARGLLELVETTETARRLAPLLKWLPTDAFDLEVRRLSDAELIVSESSDPYAPVNRHVEALRTAETFRGAMSVVGKHGLETAYDRVLSGTADHELVIEEGAAETLTNDPAYENLVDDMLATGNCRVFVHEGELPYYLGLTEECVQIGVEDDESMPRALVESESDAVRTWAEETYAAFKEEASALD